VGVLLLVLGNTLVSKYVVVALLHLPGSTLVSKYVVVALLHLPGSRLVSKYVQNYRLLESFTILHSLLKKFTTSYKDKLRNNMYCCCHCYSSAKVVPHTSSTPLIAAGTLYSALRWIQCVGLV
jgi:hypothetical protein